MLRLAALFSAHRVVQSGQPLPIWGWASPGDKVTVSLASQSAEAASGKDGRWQATLAPLKPGGPFVLEVHLKAPGIDQPEAVRYAWAGSPDSNLVNSEGLPAAPFRTDDWPVMDKKW